MRTRISLVALVLVGLAGCKQLLGIEELDSAGDGPPVQGDSTPLVDCTAQRVVHLVGGDGGLAWFTLEWPVPAVILNFTTSFAFDDPSAVTNVGVAGHPLFAREIGQRVLWGGTGANPQPTAIVAGTNETHTATPGSIVRSNPSELVANGAALQASLQPALPVLAFDPVGGAYGPAPNAPTAAVVPTIDAAIALIRNTGAAVDENELRPSAEQLARYVAPGAVNSMTALATNLAFTANAFRLGLIATVLMPAFRDDPHGAFASPGIATQRANELAKALDAFYTDLAVTSEPSCGTGGNPLALSDNVVLMVTGDTPKDSFTNSGWPDGTAGNANYFYIRTNGFLSPGWFGLLSIEAGTKVRTTFDPITGANDNTGQAGANTASAYAAALFAIARGDRAKVEAITAAPFSGLTPESD